MSASRSSLGVLDMPEIVMKMARKKKIIEDAKLRDKIIRLQKKNGHLKVEAAGDVFKDVHDEPIVQMAEIPTLEQRFPREFKSVTRKPGSSICSDVNRESQESLKSIARSRFSSIHSVIQQSRIQDYFQHTPILATRNQDLAEVKSEIPIKPPDDAAHNLGPVDQCLVKLEELEMNIISMMRSSIDAIV